MKSFLISFSIIFATSALTASTMMEGQLSTDDENGIEIKDVEYDYNMFSDGGRMDCTGLLQFYIIVPPEGQRVLVYRTRKHLIEGDRLYPFAVSEWDIDSNRIAHVSLKNISWGTYFKVCVLYDNDIRVYSSFYCVNSYIDKDDLNRLLNQASVESPVSGLFSIKVLDKDLVIDTSETVKLAVVDLHGNILFSGNLSKPTTIPIDNAASSVIITRSTINGKTTTNKFLLK